MRCVILDVCPFICSLKSSVSKQLSVSSSCFTTSWPYYASFLYQTLWQNSDGVVLVGMLHINGAWKIYNFWPVSGCNSEMIRCKIYTLYYGKLMGIMYDLSSDVIVSDPEGPLQVISAAANVSQNFSLYHEILRVSSTEQMTMIKSCVNHCCCCFIMAVLYISRGKAIMFYCCTLFFFLFQRVISEVNGRIPFILSHNIWS